MCLSNTHLSKIFFHRHNYEMSGRRIGYTQRPDEGQSHCIRSCQLAYISDVGKSVTSPIVRSFVFRPLPSLTTVTAMVRNKGIPATCSRGLMTGRRELRVCLGLSAGISHTGQRIRTKPEIIRFTATLDANPLLPPQTEFFAC